jgi:D-alanyl-D-alanine endopeptidase (penicillin-binding protein 7)
MARGDKMKNSMLLFSMLAFLASPMVSLPEAQAAQTGKSKAHKAKHKHHHIAKKSARAGRHCVVAQKQVMTPLRAVPREQARNDSHLNLRSAAALVVDQKTGETLYSKNIDVPTSIASITKLMTAMVTLDAKLELGEELVIGNEDVDHIKGTGSRLMLGTRLTREELMHLALIASENRAAAALSRAYPGGREAFVTAMNRKARAIGMNDSHFVDGTGLNSSNRSTAADLVKMVEAAYTYPLIREITSTGSYDVSVPRTRVVRVREHDRTHKVARVVQSQMAFNNTNSLTRNQDWEIGVSKTGFINEAGHCLVMQTSIDEQKVIIVLLDSWGKYSRIGDAQRIRQWLQQDNHAAGHTHDDAA